MKSCRCLCFPFEISFTELASVIQSGLHIGQYKIVCLQRKYLFKKSQTIHSSGNLKGGLTKGRIRIVEPISSLPLVIVTKLMYCFK